MADVGVGYTYKKKITNSRFCHSHQQFSNMVIWSQADFGRSDPNRRSNYGTYWSDHPLSLQHRDREDGINCVWACWGSELCEGQRYQ